MTYSCKDLLCNLARYNTRANHELYDVLAGVTDRARKRDMGSWFGSIHGVLNHVIVCDMNWLRRYRALAPDSRVLKDPFLDTPRLSWNHPLDDDFESLAESRGIVDGLILDWFAEYPEARYADDFVYRDSSGADFTATAAEAFQFLLIHQTHHRGQISQILDVLGTPNNVADNHAFLESEAPQES